MGLFDEIKDKLTTSDEERAQHAQELAKKAADEAAAAKAKADELAKKAGMSTAQAAPAQAAPAQAAPAQAAPAQAAPAQAAPAAPAQAAPAQAAPKPAAPKPAEKPLRTHTVVSGDTLSEIGQKYGVNWREIAQLNHIKNPDLIHPGEVFKIPNS